MKRSLSRTRTTWVRRNGVEVGEVRVLAGAELREFVWWFEFLTHLLRVFATWFVFLTLAASPALW